MITHMMLRNHYANELRRNTQIITQIITQITQSLRNSITQIRLRNSSKSHFADYANTDFNYA